MHIDGAGLRLHRQLRVLVPMHDVAAAQHRMRQIQRAWKVAVETPQHLTGVGVDADREIPLGAGRVGHDRGLRVDVQHQDLPILQQLRTDEGIDQLPVADQVASGDRPLDIALVEVDQRLRAAVVGDGPQIRPDGAGRLIVAEDIRVRHDAVLGAEGEQLRVLARRGRTPEADRALQAALPVAPDPHGVEAGHRLTGADVQQHE